MKGWHFDHQDNEAQRRILRRSEVAQRARIRFPRGTRIIGRVGGQTGTVLRHVPGTSSQGGTLTVQWDNGHVGRGIGPVSVRAIEVTDVCTPTFGDAKP